MIRLSNSKNPPGEKRRENYPKRFKTTLTLLLMMLVFGTTSLVTQAATFTYAPVKDNTTLNLGVPTPTLCGAGGAMYGWSQTGSPTFPAFTDDDNIVITIDEVSGLNGMIGNSS